MNRRYSRRFTTRLWLVMLAALVALGPFGGIATAVTPATGTSIGNQASATYVDSDGVAHTVTSNIVYTIVQQVASQTLTANNTKYAPQAASVSFPHTITNTGNGTDTFALTTVQLGDDTFNFTEVKIYPDVNGDGIADAGAGVITSTTPLPQGGVFKFVVVGTQPVPAPAVGATASLTVTATSGFNAAVVATNTDTVTIATNAVIETTKTMNASSGNSPSGPFTITLQYTNSGSADATAYTIEDILPAGFTYVAGSGRWSGSGATALTDTSGADDPVGITYSYSALTTKITAQVATVTAGASSSITFQVMVADGTAAGTLFNSATFNYMDGGTPAVLKSGITNTFNFTVNRTTSVTATNVTVASASQGATVTFSNTYTNTGNHTDSYDITVGTSTFPAGTTFVLYQADGVSPLMDTTGNGISDSGPIQAGASVTVVLRATLPTGFSGAGPYSVQKTATSTLNPAVSATSTDTLNAILSSSVDLTNTLSIAGGATAANGLGKGPEVNPVSTISVNPGNTVTFDLWVNNTSAVSDSYTLQGSMDSTFTTLTFPAGFDVRFLTITGTVVTSTGVIAAGQAKEFRAEITVPSNAPAGTYKGYFRVISPTSGAWDIMTDALTVNTMRSLTITPNNTGQVVPGGSVVYTHTLANTGNVFEGNGSSSVLVTAANTASGFSYAIYWDKDNNGVLGLSDPLIGDVDSMVDGTNGASVAAGLNVGESATLFVKVYAQAGSAIGVVDTLTLRATATQGIYTVLAPSASAGDNTTVIAGQLVLQKLQALDATCDGTPDTAFSQANITTGAIPGACIRYRTNVTNTGTTSVTSIIVSDSTPAFTIYDNGDGATSINGEASYSKDGGTTWLAATAPADGATGTIMSDIGTLASGQSAIVSFGVKILP